ncbi:MAG: ribonuclease E/G, partial [Pseudomonadota bacterium]|nr:ribonuclease E/G [Pseudomonadota bacterium]
MSGEVLINLTPMETRVAVVENGVLQEAFIERARRRGIVGNIYQGKVVRVLPGMQAAFVDIGLSRAAFIHAHDVGDHAASGEEQPSISHLLHEGQSLVVQVTKDPIGSKGARLTTHLSVPSRYLVYMPDSPHNGVSQRIEDETERERLRELVEAAQAEQQIDITGGFIVRTAAEGVTLEEMAADMHFLLRLWRKVSERKITAPAPSVIYDDLPLFMRTLRDVMRDDIEKVRIDSRENFVKLVEFAEEFMPTAVGRI